MRVWVIATFWVLAARLGAQGEPSQTADSVFSWWEKLRCSASLRTFVFHLPRDPGSGDYLGESAQIKALPVLSDSVQGKIEFRAADLKLGKGHENGQTDFSLLEAYLVKRFSDSDLRIGRQIIIWGRADGINPTDNITPRDYVTWLPYEEDQRHGAILAKYDFYLGKDLSLSLIWKPFFDSSRTALPNVARPFINRSPATTLGNSQVGIKLNKSGGAIDWSASYFHGYSLLPDFRVANVNANGPQLELDYDRIDVLGADVARNFGKYGFRGEAAWTKPSGAEGRMAFKQTYLYYVLGVDRTFEGNLNINFQLFGRHLQNFHDPERISDPLERTIAIQNAITDYQQDKDSYGLTMRINKKWAGETIETELLAIVNTTRNNAFLRPFISYAFSDHWKATLGSVYYRGEAETPFGRKRVNNRLFTEMKYTF